MIDRRSMLGLGVLGVAAGLAGPSLAAAAKGAKRAGGWIVLFDGKNLDNFETIGKADWRLMDGVAESDTGVGYLVSKENYTDFDIKAEFWVSDDANSGVFIRCTNPRNVTAGNAYECNIFDQRPDQDYATGAIVDVAKPIVKPAKTGGKWNTIEVSARGDTFSVSINGVKTVDKAKDVLHSHGRIALQHMAGVVKFRRVEIRPIDD